MALETTKICILNFLMHTVHFNFSIRGRFFHQPLAEAIKINHGQYQI